MTRAKLLQAEVVIAGMVPSKALFDEFEIAHVQTPCLIAARTFCMSLTLETSLETWDFILKLSCVVSSVETQSYFSVHAYEYHHSNLCWNFLTNLTSLSCGGNYLKATLAWLPYNRSSFIDSSIKAQIDNQDSRLTLWKASWNSWSVWMIWIWHKL